MFVAHDEQIEIAAEVGPVIQRFYHRDRASGRVELGANSLQARECMSNAVVLAVERGLREGGKFCVTIRSRVPLQWLQRSDDYVMVIRQAKKFRSPCRILAGNMLDHFGGPPWRKNQQ